MYPLQKELLGLERHLVLNDIGQGFDIYYCCSVPQAVM